MQKKTFGKTLRSKWVSVAISKVEQSAIFHGFTCRPSWCWNYLPPCLASPFWTEVKPSVMALPSNHETGKHLFSVMLERHSNKRQCISYDLPGIRTCLQVRYGDSSSFVGTLARFNCAPNSLMLIGLWLDGGGPLSLITTFCMHWWMHQFNN